jgi:hypothetical protein
MGVVAAAASAAIAVYAAYGDPHPKANQQSGVPSVVVAGIIVAAVVFGFLVPRSLRAVASGRAYGIVGLVLVPIAFWSGIPLVVGGAGLAVGLRARSEGRDDTTRASTVAMVTGACAVGLTVLITVLGNTVLAR